MQQQTHENFLPQFTKSQVDVLIFQTLLRVVWTSVRRDVKQKRTSFFIALIFTILSHLSRDIRVAEFKSIVFANLGDPSCTVQIRGVKTRWRKFGFSSTLIYHFSTWTQLSRRSHPSERKLANKIRQQLSSLRSSQGKEDCDGTREWYVTITLNTLWYCAVNNSER